MISLAPAPISPGIPGCGGFFGEGRSGYGPPRWEVMVMREFLAYLAIGAFALITFVVTYKLMSALLERVGS